MSFFESLRKSASNATFEAQKLVRTQRRQLSITNLRKERDGNALELGNRTAEKVRDQELQDLELEQLARTVLDLDDRIRTEQEELERIRAEQPPYQDAPAQTQPDAPAQPVSTGPRCGNCGATLQPGATFCTSCGARVPVAQPTPTQSPTGATGGFAPESLEAAQTDAPLGRMDEIYEPPAAPQELPPPPAPEAAPPGPLETRLLTEAETAASAQQGAEETQSLAQERPKFCTNCGDPVTPEEVFCTNCGTRLAPTTGSS